MVQIGFDFSRDWDYNARGMKDSIEKDITINIPVKKNKILQKALDLINQNEELKTMWKVVNVNAMERLAMSDHGPVHVQIVANSSLRIARLLLQQGIELSTSKDYELNSDYSELVVVLAGLLHDLGMTINRKGHEGYSLMLATKIIDDVLVFLPIQERIVVRSEVLHAIISHRKDGQPITLEAGILRFADALDMTEGRSRIPFQQGATSIHALSNQAIEDVSIEKGADIPVEIIIRLNNSAGIFQIDELLKGKLRGSGLEQYIKVKAVIEGDSEKKLLTEYTI